MPEFLVPQNSLSAPAATGLAARRVVNMSTNGSKLRYPVAGGSWDGVLFGDSSTGSTAAVSLPLQVGGVALIEAAGSTVHAGHLVTATSIGRVAIWSTGKVAVGKVLMGSSGSTGRLLSVLLYHVGHSTLLS
jgi:hypothetical protein